MKHLLHRQKGITGMAIFLILIVLGCFVLFGLTAFPLYNEYFGVKSSMQAVINQPPAKRETTKDIQKLFLKNTQINNVSRFKDSNVKDHVTVQKSKDGKTKYLNVKYQSENNLFKNLYLMMKVDESIELTGSAPK